MFSSAFSVVYLIFAILFFVYLCHFLATKKGLDPVFWGVMGGLFGPLVIPVILLIKSRKSTSE